MGNPVRRIQGKVALYLRELQRKVFRKTASSMVLEAMRSSHPRHSALRVYPARPSASAIFANSSEKSAPSALRRLRRVRSGEADQVDGAAAAACLLRLGSFDGLSFSMTLGLLQEGDVFHHFCICPRGSWAMLFGGAFSISRIWASKISACLAVTPSGTSVAVRWRVCGAIAESASQRLR